MIRTERPIGRRRPKEEPGYLSDANT